MNKLDLEKLGRAVINAVEEELVLYTIFQYAGDRFGEKFILSQDEINVMIERLDEKENTDE